MGTKLTSENVSNCFMACLFKDGEPTDNPKIGEGLRMRAGFNPQRLEEHREVIEAMLRELPDSFQRSGGGGMSFLNLCQDKHGNQWADLHQTMEQLVCLGNAIGKLSFPVPKELWDALPGGVPYIVVESEPAIAQ